MRNIFILTLISLIFLSCTPLDRVNPTDPEAENYIGITYKGSFGEFSNLEDFVVKNGYIYTVDNVKEECGKYTISGDMEFSFSGSFSNPTGICADDNYIYVVNKGAKDIIVFNPQSADTILNPVNDCFPLTANATAKIEKIAVDNNYIYLTSDEPKIYKYNKSDILNTNIANYILVWGNYGETDGEFKNISCIKIYNNTIIVADSVLNRISFFDGAGNFLRKINFNKSIKGFMIKDGKIYIASNDGISEYAYDTGEFIKKWADYGDGDGKVTKPSLIDFYNNSIFVENTTNIKIFGP